MIIRNIRAKSTLRSPKHRAGWRRKSCSQVSREESGCAVFLLHFVKFSLIFSPDFFAKTTAGQSLAVNSKVLSPTPARIPGNSGPAMTYIWRDFSAQVLASESAKQSGFHPSTEERRCAVISDDQYTNPRR